MEVKKLEQKLRQAEGENERYHIKHSDQTTELEKLEVQRKTLKDDLREVKFRENRLLQDYSELEEENIAMQKQVGDYKRLRK